MAPIRVRFAPSPTGYMHIANVRVALLNWLYARANNGTFILRIEDTDQERLIDSDAKQIQADLQWLGLNYSEGPFFQSQRNTLYQEYLQILIEKNQVYRCFCSHEELENKRALQIATGIPPCYDRTCMQLSRQLSDEKAARGEPFIWRLQLPDALIVFHDSARGTISFDLGLFSDPALTRANGTCTFIFANLVDDIDMRISYVIRGEDHLTNTAIQVHLYRLFNKEVPPFYHLPIMLGSEGKKMSKRDFGSSLKDLQEAGYMCEAVNNYLGIIGLSLDKEILSLDELSKVVPFDTRATTGTVHYDINKFNWINHEWIKKLSLQELAVHIQPFITKAYPSITAQQQAAIDIIIPLLQQELVTLAQVGAKIAFLFSQPVVSHEYIGKELQIDSATLDKINTLLATMVANFESKTITDSFNELTAEAKKQNIPNKILYSYMRYALTGSTSGIGVRDVLRVLERDEIKQRLLHIVHATK